MCYNYGLKVVFYLPPQLATAEHVLMQPNQHQYSVLVDDYLLKQSQVVIVDFHLIIE